MSTKEEVSQDTRARRLLERTNPLIVMPGPGLTGDSVPSNLFSMSDFEQEKRNLFLNLDNFEVVNTLSEIGRITGKQSNSGPLVGELKTLTISGVNNAVNYATFGEGVWQVEDVVVTYTGGSGTINHRLYVYDSTDGNPAIEVLFAAGTSSTLFNFNNDTQFDEFANKKFGKTTTNGDRQLGFKPSGTFDAGSMTAYVICHRVR